MAQINRLSELKVKGKLAPGWHADGGNLFLRVRETGTRSWFFRYKVAGRVKEIGLGSPTDRKLKDVRQLAADMRSALANKTDPSDVLKAPEEAEAKTFKAYAEELVAAKVIGFRNAKHIQQWTNTLRGAMWAEIDEKAKTWVIPGERMKAGREHKVPLSDAALDVLTTMKPRKAEGSDLIFPGPTGAALSDVAVNKTLKAILADVTVHGFRSSFRIWGAEATSYPSAVLELALAHVNKNETEAAYQRSDLFEPRKKLMAAWAKYCSKGGKLIDLHTANAA